MFDPWTNKTNKFSMRRIHFLVLIILLFGCGKETAPAEPTATLTPDETQGIQEELPGIPGFKKVEIRDAKERIITTGYLLNGKKESSWVEYYPNDKLFKTLTTYSQGKKEGLAIEFNFNQIVRQYFYHNDLRHGEFKEYNGTNLKEIRYYEKGKQEGLTVLYYDSGPVMEESYYKDGQRDGTSKWYDQKGKLTIEYEYKKGELVKK